MGLHRHSNAMKAHVRCFKCHRMLSKQSDMLYVVQEIVEQTRIASVYVLIRNPNISIKIWGCRINTGVESTSVTLDDIPCFV
jgi:hypothetical protein